MIDVRIGLAVDDVVNDKLVALCARLDISKGAFVTAMVEHIEERLIDEAVAAYKADHEVKRGEILAQRKELKKKLKSLTPAEIEQALAARKAA